MRRPTIAGVDKGRFSSLLWLVVSFALFITPAAASATALPSTLTSNMTLTASGGPYTGGYVAVPKGITLKMEPGAVVKITDGLTVAGVLAVNGSSEKPVAFTSLKDDAIGGDTNGDGSATSPSPGDWRGLEIGSMAEGHIEHAIIRYAGNKLAGAINYQCPCAAPPSVEKVEVRQSLQSGIRIVGGSPSIRDSAIVENGAFGIVVQGGSPEVEDNLIANNSQGISLNVPAGLHGAVDFNDNVVAENTGVGISVSAAFDNTFLDSASLGGNEVRDNGGKAIVFETAPNASEKGGAAMNPLPPNLTTNVLSGNAKNGIWISGSINESQTWSDPGYALVAFNNGISVPKGRTLTLESGVVIKNEGPNLFVAGTLKSNGTAEDPVIVTSAKDDSAAGDTNGDGSATSPKAGDWPEFRFTGGGNPASSTISHTQFRYGGNKSHAGAAMVEVLCPCSNPPEFVHTTFSLSANSGVRLVESAASVWDGAALDNAEAGIKVEAGTPEVHGNFISGNAEGILFNVPAEKHGSVDIGENVIEGNDLRGIWVRAPSGNTFIDSASLGGNEVIANGGRAIIYETMPGSPNFPASAANPIPADIATNIVSENDKNGIWISGSINESQTWSDPGYALVAFNNGITVREGNTLSLGPGIVLKNEQPNIIVYGVLESNGNSLEPVVITSLEDDTVAGDTNGDASTTNPKAGDWEAVVFPTAEGVELDHLDIRYAEKGIRIEYLVSMYIESSDFIGNDVAIAVAETAPSDPALAALPCAPPYLSFVDTNGVWFGEGGLPSPSIDVSSLAGAVVPSEYQALFAPFLLQINQTYPLWGATDSIPWSLYSCPPQKIPLIALSPVLYGLIPGEPNFPH